MKEIPGHRGMSLLKLVRIWLRKLQSFLLLGVTICLLFYYTFENEIDMLNSYAENEYMPSINGDGANSGTANIHLDDGEVPLISETPNGVDAVSPSPDHVIPPVPPVGAAHSISPPGAAHLAPPVDSVAVDLGDPKILKEKNRYFPLLLSSPWRGSSSRFQDKWINPDTSDLSKHKDMHVVLNEISLPLDFRIVPNDYTNIQSNYFEDGGSQQNELLQEVLRLFVKSWDQEEFLKSNSFSEIWPLSLVDSLDTLYIMGQISKFNEVVGIISKVDFSVPPTVEDSIDIPDVSSRVLGGLISAYELSGEPILLKKATELADFILRAFDTPNRIPILQYFWRSEFQNRFPYQYMNVGSLTNMALELVRLAQITHSNIYFDAVQRIYRTISLSLDEFAIEHMFPTAVDGSGCRMLTTSEVLAGDHLRDPKVMKSIDQNLEFVHCLQTGLFLSSPHDWEKEEQSFRMDYQDQSVYSNLVKMYHLLNGHDLLAISKTSHSIDEENKEGVLDESASDNYMRHKETDGSESWRKKTLLHNSKQLFLTAMRKINDLMIYRPLTPIEGHNLTLISSLKTKTYISPSIDELQVEIKKSFDMNHEGCSLAATLALASRLFHNVEYMQLAKKLTKSYFEMTKLLGGIFPEDLRLDPCEKEICLFDKSEKIQSIRDGKYTSHETSMVGDTKVELEGSPSHRGGITGMRKILKFASAQGIEELDYDIQDIDSYSEIWREDPDRPLWINKIGKKRLLPPNLIESIFYMYRITGELQWRKMGAELLKMTIENLQKYHSGAKGVWNVRELDDDDDSSIPSSWFSQTLKYYYLLFSDSSDFSLDRYLYTSGGHLMKRDAKNL